MDIKEFEKDLEQSAKTASEWLTAETKRILQEEGRFYSAEHTKSIYSIMAVELEKKGYCKQEELIKAVLAKVLGFCADDEVGMKYLIKRTAKEYGVEL